MFTSTPVFAKVFGALHHPQPSALDRIETFAQTVKRLILKGHELTKLVAKVKAKAKAKPTTK